MTTQGMASEERISQFDYDLLPQLSALLGLDAVEFAKQMEEDEQKDREQMQKGFNSQMRSEVKRLKTFLTYKPFSSWTPQEMAAAGFYFTGVKSGVQCFCCSLILFGTSLSRLPIEDHKKFRPDCEFLSSKDVGNIAKYDVKVKHPEHTFRRDQGSYQEEKARLDSFKNWPFYAQGTSPQALSAAGFIFTADCYDSIFANEDLRLGSFKNWPHESLVGPAALAKAGLFYTGVKDIVQCFSCSGRLENWKEGDDPLEDHTKFFPNCQFLQNMKSSAEVIPDFQSHGELAELTETTSENNLEDSVAVSSVMPVTILPSFVSLKILNLNQQQFPDKETAENFAYTLGFLHNLEELILPTGDGICQVAKLIIQQCQKLQWLRVLSFSQTLNDDSVMEIGELPPEKRV
ncbi:Baculoviral IAP repeat-containing protein 1a [Tupaia chinensis]|uniref:Baculoviral IAP repeat-containing protein 1a n=1 Tax=Tupaia chinensis TaxID=246437 RepID=L8Y5P7_TUPCH|nr:Baculoviral IAP repeat-containing protein 1a [Tupaia chinensis]